MPTVKTSKALAYTLKDLVGLTKYLLSTSHKFVKLGEFTSDPLKKLLVNYLLFFCSTSLRKKPKLNTQNYFYNSGFHELHIGHTCMNCQRQLTKKESEIFDSLNILGAIKMMLILLVNFNLRLMKIWILIHIHCVKRCLS